MYFMAKINFIIYFNFYCISIGIVCVLLTVWGLNFNQKSEILN